MDTQRRMPGADGESGAEALDRYDAVVAEAYETGAATAALVSHGAAIRMWVAARADNLTVDFAERYPLENTGVVALDGSPAAGWRALTWEGAAVPRPAGVPDGGPAGEAITP